MTNKLIISEGDGADVVYTLGFRLNSPCVILIKEQSKSKKSDKNKEIIALIPELELGKAKRLTKKISTKN